MLCRLTALALTVALWLAPTTALRAQDAAVDVQLKAAAGALQQGLVEQAVQLYSDALADKGLSSDRRAVVHNDRGVAQIRRQQWKLAIDDFNRAVVLYPEYAPAYNNRGNALVAVGMFREAIKDFDRALMLSPTYSAVFANRASAWFRLGDRDAALADYSRAIELTPQSVSALNGRGLVHATAERPHAAIRDFSRAVAVDARFAAGYRNRAAAKAVTERTDEAIEDLSRAIAFDGKSVESHLLRADAYLDAGNAASALKDFNRAIELSPRSAPAYAGRALALAKADAFDDALNDLVKAIEIDPKLSRAYAVRAWVYKQMQQLDLAAKDIERALKLEPITADAHWAAGEIDEARSRTEAAVQAYTKALGVNARHKSTLDALNRLGLVATREETEVQGAGVERWRVLASGDHYVAVNDTLAGLRVPLEMLGKGAPKLVAWDRQKPPHAGFGVLRFTAGRIENPGLDLEAAAIIDIATPALLGLPLNKRGEKSATWTWDEGKLVVASAEGLTEEFPLKGVRGGTPVASVTPEKSATPRRERDRDTGGGGSKSGGAPSWSPWAQPGSNSQPNRQASKPQKPASIFELLFGK